MSLSKEDGFKIREEHSTLREKFVCDNNNLEQLGGSKTKVDGFNSERNVSIKNAKGSSTQVHLTTQKQFIKVLDLNHNCQEFVKLFCGNKEMNNNGKDRYTIKQIDSLLIESFHTFLTNNTTEIIDLVIRNGFNITDVIYFDITKNIQYELTYNEILTKIKGCTWVFKNGGIHLKNENNKTYFHFQREGKKNKNNRYNVLWHIHKNLFL